MSDILPLAEDDRFVNATTVPGRMITHRTRGTSLGPMTRLVSPSGLGPILKPFVFLDFIDRDGPAFDGDLHPHSGIATLTYLSKGIVNYIDHDGHLGQMTSGAVEWMRAGRGMWHGGGVGAGPMLGFQLWIALPPELELSPPESLYVDANEIEHSGPARVLFGEYGPTKSKISSPMNANYLAVKLKASESWRYLPPRGHLVLWIAVASGILSGPDNIGTGELVVFEQSGQAVTFTAKTDVEFVLGSAAPHDHELVLGNYSVHTSAQALLEGERRIASLGSQLTR